MCGIAGIMAPSAPREALATQVRLMINTLAHRGPDGEGVYADNGIALGHRRLAIIDPVAGQQPFQSWDGRWTLVYNGELYNYIELRKELESEGAVFTTDSDVEVLLAVLTRRGLDGIHDCNGMWAFALWDRHRRELTLCRDRCGEKPLYYKEVDGGLLFASELKALFAAGVEKQPDWGLLELYLTLGFVPAPYTFFKGINKLSPGNWLLAHDGKISVQPYWRLPQPDEQQMNRDSAAVVETFRHLFTDSVRLRMRSDVPFGAFLSGGLDSASVVACMTENSQHAVRTFTIAFPEPEFDERSLAQLVVERYGTQHRERMLEPDDIDAAVSAIARHYDEPFGDASAMPTRQVCALASEDVKMVLTGDGGDEVLSGYTTYQGERFASRYQRWPRGLQSVIPSVLHAASGVLRGSVRYRLNRAERICHTAALDFEARVLEKASRISPERAVRLASGHRCVSAMEWMHDQMEDCRFRDPFYRLMYFQFRCTLPDRMLTKVDRVSMAHSLETRLPFLDHRLVEFMVGADQHVKLPGYERKRVLREAMRTRLPTPLLRAAKRGFAVPLRHWFRERSLNPVLNRLIDVEWGVNSAEIRRMVAAHRSGEEDLGDGLWVLLVLRQVLS